MLLHVSDLFVLEKPSLKSFMQISKELVNHYEPERVIIAGRFHFHKMDQAVGESITDFDAMHRKLATHCDFGTMLDDSLLDQTFLCRMLSEKIVPIQM